jgi:hypothetical protein
MKRLVAALVSLGFLAIATPANLAEGSWEMTAQDLIRNIFSQQTGETLGELYYQNMVKEREPGTALVRYVVETTAGNFYTATIKVYLGIRGASQFVSFAKGLVPSPRLETPRFEEALILAPQELVQNVFYDRTGEIAQLIVFKDVKDANDPLRPLLRIKTYEVQTLKGHKYLVSVGVAPSGNDVYSVLNGIQRVDTAASCDPLLEK